MSLKLPLFALVAFLPAAVFANVGIFRGWGQSIQLESTAEIQMVSETVDITLGRGMFPVNGGVDGFDVAEYRCAFTLRNLTDKEVSVQVGFPLSSVDNAWLPFRKDYDASKSIDVVMRHNFIAGSAKCQYPVRYVVEDKDKKFRSIFLWDMQFAPKEEIVLKVSYAIPGYIGLGVTKKKPYNWGIRYKEHCLGSLNDGFCEAFGYVTETGKSWSGKIEKATFTVHLGRFEDYLERRGMREFETPEEKQKFENVIPFATGCRIRSVEPSGWTEQMEGVTKFSKGYKTLTWEYADFQPGAELQITYIFTLIPRTADDFKKLLALMDNKRAKHSAMLKKSKNAPPAEDLSSELTPEERRDIADVILEYYGITRDNPRISDYLTDQVWYPMSNPPPLDEGLKAELLELSGISTIFCKIDNSFVPKAGVAYSLEIGNEFLYKPSPNSGPPDLTLSKAWSHACEFVFRTALSNTYRLPSQHAEFIDKSHCKVFFDLNEASRKGREEFLIVDLERMTIMIPNDMDVPSKKDAGVEAKQKGSP